MKNEFFVENIKCGGCMNSIKSALISLDNVENVEINKDIDAIYVTGQIDKEKIIAKLKDLGYPEKGNNSIMSKAKSYVSCAVGKMAEMKN